jgi:ABC-type multidrug transport system fused ATPase/permease subunit
METSKEVQARIDEFHRELDVMIRARRRQAKANYYFSYILMIVTVLSSAVAGIGGLIGQFDAKVVGAIALLPGFIALTVAMLKPQTRANVQYRSLAKLYEFRGLLKFGLPEAPSADDVRKVFELFNEAQASLDKELAALSFDWSGFAPPSSQIPAPGNRSGRCSNIPG